MENKGAKWSKIPKKTYMYAILIAIIGFVVVAIGGLLKGNTLMGPLHPVSILGVLIAAGGPIVLLSLNIKKENR